MTDQQAKEVSELYKKKSQLTGDLSTLMQGEKIQIEVYGGKSYMGSTLWGLYHDPILFSTVKTFLCNEIKERIKEIDNKLSSYSCS